MVGKIHELEFVRNYSVFLYPKITSRQALTVATVSFVAAFDCKPCVLNFRFKVACSCVTEFAFDDAPVLILVFLN
jgi:hypothetical protein